ncbi:RadC family protein [Lyngbya confervoides]|uniref:DNA repair protein RadC n=1 Tax=Lyngbya confervoides BDU141951 TaxID=1574623 RepID=A0ABD4T3H2_9CYAN|nr:DNA repair protein RadC [Lyngbya confervoides]MCM1982797.1 DNA repair protein RadC [Lyngbya confervoides BDU141951]
MGESLRVLDLPESDRPRERLLAQGAATLTPAELLAILLGTGQGAGKLSALGLGQLMWTELAQMNRDPLRVLREISAPELMEIPGIGPAKAATILAALELGKRVHHALPPSKTLVDDPAVAAAALAEDLMWQPRERFAVLFLDIKHRIMGKKVVSIGTATETLANPREIFREVIRQGATRMIVAHNHPSGSLEASVEDLDLTRQLLQGSKLLEIPLLDHLILGQGEFVSLRQTTSLWDSDRVL